jgi:hypothetical protein
MFAVFGRFVVSVMMRSAIMICVRFVRTRQNRRAMLTRTMGPAAHQRVDCKHQARQQANDNSHGQETGFKTALTKAYPIILRRTPISVNSSFYAHEPLAA